MARKSKTPRRASRAREDSGGVEESNTNGADHYTSPQRQPTDWSKVEPDFEFKIRYPPEASKKRKRGNDTEPISQSGPFGEELNTVYTVSPADRWEDTKRYRKFTIAQETCEVSGVVLVKNDEDVIKDATDNTPAGSDAPPPARVRSSLAEILQKHWVAKVLEVRAGDEQHVYLRVYWLFRPEDLPGGRQWYHGSNELIASNEMQIIDAMTVDGTVDVKHWIETNDDDDIPPDQLVWRQTYNFKTQQLSELRKHCACGLQYNPDTMLIGCTNPVCRKWLHGACILEDAVKRARESHGDDNITVQTDSAAAADGADETPSKTPQKKRGRSKKGSVGGGGKLGGVAASGAASTDSFSAEVVERESGKFKVVVTDSRDGRKTRTYEEDVVCLVCKEKVE